MKMLASVQNVNEAEAVLAAGVEMIDLKQPAEGALGALSPAVMDAILDHIASRACTSATIGDLPMQPALLRKAVQSVAATGVDIVKVGMFGHSHHAECIEALAPLTQSGTRLVAVLFADQKPNYGLLPDLAEAGFYGVMLDTAHKDGRSLRDHMTTERLQEFVQLSHQNALLCGLAGALKLPDIPPLAKISPDYIGFRSALVKSGKRADNIDGQLLSQVRQMLLLNNNSTESLNLTGGNGSADCNQMSEWV